MRGTRSLLGVLTLFTACVTGSEDELYLDAADSGHTAACGSRGAGPLAREDRTTVCLGFQAADDPTGGRKAIFDVRVDHYSSMRVDTLRGIYGLPWSAKEPYSNVWVGLHGRRTVGQLKGKASGGTCNATATRGKTCYGWAEHNKPVMYHPTANQISTGLTAIVHLDMGRVSRIMWDSSCNLCSQAKGREME